MDFSVPKKLLIAELFTI